MIFDSEKQRAQVRRLILESPIETTIEGILSGPSDELVELMMAIDNATIAEPEGEASDGDSG